MSYDPAIRSEVDQQIAQSSSQAANALQTLAMIQRARTAPAPSSLDETTLPEELRRKTTVNYSGPGDEVVKDLAGRIGYAFLETGSKPTVPSMVNLTLTDTSVGKALEDIGLQVQVTATVIVNPSARSIEYRNESGNRSTNTSTNTTTSTSTTTTTTTKPAPRPVHRVISTPAPANQS
jgi:defect-in-organelle-trafficking protein DotD